MTNEKMSGDVDLSRDGADFRQTLAREHESNYATIDVPSIDAKDLMSNREKPDAAVSVETPKA